MSQRPIQQGDILRDLQRDLHRRYLSHGAKIQEIWRSFSPAQRTRAMKAGSMKGLVLKHPYDDSLGDVCKYMPEYNLRDATSSPDHVLAIIRYRAMSSLVDQYISGPDGGEGDLEFVERMMVMKGLRLTDGMDYTDCFTTFHSEESYGQSMKLNNMPREQYLRMPGIEAGWRARAIVEQSLGQLVMTRQTYLLQSLVILVEDILELGSTTRTQNTRPKKTAEEASAAMSKLSLSPQQQAILPKADLPSLLSETAERKSALGETLDLLCTEPVVLAHAVNIWFYSRPELVADDKGRSLPVHTDRYISPSVLDTMHNSVKATAVWDYLNRLLALYVEDSSDKMFRGILLQEIVNICQLEYARAQALMKRSVATGTGRKWFKRTNAMDNGVPRVVPKGDQAKLLISNPQLYYLLRLCQADTTSAKSLEWFQKLDELHRSHPSEQENISEREYDSIADLAAIASFINSLSQVLSLPSASRKKGQHFIAKSSELEGELNSIKNEIDLGDFVIPIDNLLEPGKAEAALNLLDVFVVERTGTKMGFLYQDLIEECLANLQQQYNLEKSKIAAPPIAAAPSIPHSTTSKAEKPRVEERREKLKTRPTHSSLYEIKPSDRIEEDAPEMVSSQTLKVKASSLEVFTTLFSAAEARGSFSWVDFEAAMVDVGFSVLPKYGSVITFLPPSNLQVQKSVSLHRPHNSRVEKWKLLTYARRLKTVYGWGINTFELA